MSLPSQVSILIVGGGPAGLALACTLINNGVPHSSVLIVDKKSLSQKQSQHYQSRGLGIHARTLECLEESVDDSSAPPPTRNEERPKPSEPIPVEEDIKSTVQEILDRAQMVDALSLYRPGRPKPLLSMSMSLLKGETKYPFFIVYPQGNTEAILESRLHTLGGILNREWSLESFDTHGEKSIGKPIDVRLVHSSGQQANVKTMVLVGADGGHSKVRKDSQIEFPGDAYPDAFVLGDVKLKSSEWPYFTNEGFDGVNLCQFSGSAGYLFFAPLPDGYVRLVGNVESPMDSITARQLASGGNIEGREVPTQAELQEMLMTRGPTAEDGLNTITEVKWASRFHIQHRMVNTFNKGPVCLIGDAAHIHSPFGGQGFNIGVQDAVSLGLILSQFFHPTSNSDPQSYANLGDQLACWSKKRHKIASQVLALTYQLTRNLTQRNPWKLWLRNLLLPILAFIPGLIKKHLREMSGLNFR